MDGGLASGDATEVIVVADDAHRPADRRVDRPVGVPGDSDRGRDRLPQERAHPGASTGCRLKEHQLAVGAEAAIGSVDVVEEVLHRPPGCGQITVEDQEVGVRPEGAPLGVLEHGYDEPVETCARPDEREVLPLEPPPSDEPLPELVLGRVVVDPPLVVEGLLPVCVRGTVSVSWTGSAVIGVETPAYVTAASHPNPIVAASPATAVASVRSERRWSARLRWSLRARMDIGMTTPCRPTLKGT